MDFLKFAQFAKVQEQPDGSVMVWGIATLEEPDLDAEICDYDAAKSAYEKWSEAAKARTEGAGQEVSLGNIRLQHGLDIGGKATDIEYDDDNKRIMLGSVPLNDQILADIRKGYYTGYSQGGSYAWRKCTECGKNLTLQQANNYCPNCKKSVSVLFGLKRVSEVSYVDSPCTGKGFDYVKSDGTKQFVKFAKRGERVELTQEQIDQIAAQVKKAGAKTKRVSGADLTADCFAHIGDAEKTETWHLPISVPGNAAEPAKTLIRKSLKQFHDAAIPDDKKASIKAKLVAAAKAAGIDVDDAGNTKACRAFIAAAEKAATGKVEKGLYQVGRLADVLQTLSWLYDDSVIERDIEGDESEVPDDLKGVLERLVEIFIASATEEARELAAKKADTTQKGGATMTPEEKDALEKAAKKSLAAHFAKSAVHHEKMAKAHHEQAEAHEDMCEACKADEGSDLHKALGKFHKSAAANHEKMAKAHDGHAEHLNKMAESHDKEEAEKTVKAERGADPAPVTKVAEPGDFMTKATQKAEAELLADPEFMKKVKAKREEALLSSIVDKTVADEVSKRRDTTLAPDGVTLPSATNLRVAPRDADTFKLSSTAGPASDAGI
jgi:hypothetical protein